MSESKVKTLNSQRIALYWGNLGADCLRNLGHGLEVVQNLRVLQLVEVVHDPGVGLVDPNLGHHLLVVG